MLLLQLDATYCELLGDGYSESINQDSNQEIVIVAIIPILNTTGL